MSDFSFDSGTKEFLSNPYPVGIFDNNIITNVEVTRPETGSAYIDIFFENLTHGYTTRERIFELGTVPSWSTEEKELVKLKSRIKHIMARFVPEGEQIFEAHGFADMCEKVKERLDRYAVAAKAPVSIKTEWDKNFQYVNIAKYIPFLAGPNDKPLAYSETEKKRNFPEDFPVPSTVVGEPEMDDSPKSNF